MLEYLCILMQNDHEFCKLRMNRTQVVVLGNCTCLLPLIMTKTCKRDKSFSDVVYSKKIKNYRHYSKLDLLDVS